MSDPLIDTFTKLKFAKCLNKEGAKKIKKGTLFTFSKLDFITH